MGCVRIWLLLGQCVASHRDTSTFKHSFPQRVPAAYWNFHVDRHVSAGCRLVTTSSGHQRLNRDSKKHAATVMPTRD